MLYKLARPKQGNAGYAPAWFHEHRTAEFGYGRRWRRASTDRHHRNRQRHGRALDTGGLLAALFGR
jgi:hypothetical protein